MPDDAEYITDKFVSHNSLKAWKIEHDKQMSENSKNVKLAKPKSPKGGKSTPSKNRSPTTDASKKASISRPKSNESANSKDKKKHISPIREGSGKTKVGGLWVWTPKNVQHLID